MYHMTIHLWLWSNDVVFMVLILLQPQARIIDIIASISWVQWLKTVYQQYNQSGRYGKTGTRLDRITQCYEWDTSEDNLEMNLMGTWQEEIWCCIKIEPTLMNRVHWNQQLADRFSKPSHKWGQLYDAIMFNVYADAGMLGNLARATAKSWFGTTWLCPNV